MLTPAESYRRLREGNARFVANLRSIDPHLSQAQRAAMADAQRPHAIILGCSDSRVPAELVFDQGLGDLFVIRVAGNIVGDGLLEFGDAGGGGLDGRVFSIVANFRDGAVIDDVRFDPVTGVFRLVNRFVWPNGRRAFRIERIVMTPVAVMIRFIPL